MYIDSHCHINFPELNKNIDSVLSNMNEKSPMLFALALHLITFEEVITMANKYNHIFASVGVHPDYEERWKSSCR